MPLQTWAARFVVDNGRVTEEGGRLRTFNRRRIDEQDVDLHALAEPHGAQGEAFAAQALDAIGRAFLDDRLSITGGLNRALASTHQTLADWNRRSLDRDKVAIGATLLALRSLTAYLSQIGPSLVFYRHGGVLERLVPLEGAVAALGEREQLAPEVRRIDLADGDLLLAASASIESVLDFETLEGLLGRGSDEALAELYLLTRGQPSFALFLVSCFDDGSGGEETPPASAPAEEPEEPPAPAVQVRAPPEEAKPPTPAFLAQRPPLDISRPVVRLRNDQPAGREYARAAGTPARRGPQLSRPLLIAAAAVLLIAIGVVASVPDLVRTNREERTASLQEQAALAYAAALAETDLDEKRALLEETRRLAAEATRLDAGNQAALALSEQATAALNGLDQVFDLGPMAPVAVLGRLVTGEIAVDSLVVTGDNAYLLDSAGQRVVAVPFASPDTPAVIYQAGESYEGSAARTPLFMAWDGASEGGRLLVLDAERKLFEIRPGSLPAPLPLRRSSTWLSFAAIATYEGNLYVLDPDASQVHKYLPAAVGYDSEPGPALAGNPLLEGAVDLAVAGDIYVLIAAGEADAPGRLLRFRGGIEAELPLSGIDRALLSPRSVSVLAGAGELLIADTGNKRIVVVDQEGDFRRQLVSNAFIDLRAIDVDAAGSQLYAVVGDTLVTAPLIR